MKKSARIAAASLLVGGGVSLVSFYLWTKRGLNVVIPERAVSEARSAPVQTADRNVVAGKTGYKLVDKIVDKLKDAADATGIPLGLMIGWISKESGGKLSDKTNLDERGYFQLMPSESSALGLDHQRLSTDSDYSISPGGTELIKRYANTVDGYGVASRGTSYFWRLVKLIHSMGGGATKKIVNAAKKAGQAGSWEDLENFALAMKVNGPQPKKWFPFVDQVFAVGAPFGFGDTSTTVVGGMYATGLQKLLNRI